MIEMIVKDLESDDLIDWGMFAGRLAGYSISEGSEMSFGIFSSTQHATERTFYQDVDNAQVRKIRRNSATSVVTESFTKEN